MRSKGVAARPPWEPERALPKGRPHAQAYTMKEPTRSQSTITVRCAPGRPPAQPPRAPSQDAPNGPRHAHSRALKVPLASPNAQESMCHLTRPHDQGLLGGGAHPATARPRHTARPRACQLSGVEHAAAYSHDADGQSAGRREQNNREINPVADTDREKGQQGGNQANESHPPDPKPVQA